MKFGGQNWKEMVGFRNYLLKHHDVVEQYVKIKKEGLKKAFGDGEKYKKYKEKFIRKIMRQG